MGSTTPTNTDRKTVAVVGAGASGVAAAAHLLAWGLDATVFERTRKAGGVWVYDERLPPEAPFPNIRPSRADFTAVEALESKEESRTKQSLVQNGENIELNGSTNGPKSSTKKRRKFPSKDEAEIYHAPPGPAYLSLKNNIPTVTMRMKLGAWPAGTEMNTSHAVIAAYVQDLAKKHGVEERIRFGTRVERAVKDEEKKKWVLWTGRLVGKGGDCGDEDGEGEVEVLEEEWEFDYLVVASGHYHAANVPDIPGLKEWRAAFPERVQHSKRYRTPRGFENKTVLLIGGSVSATDIAIDLAPHAKKIYQSTRGGTFDLPASMLPEKATRIGQVQSFSPFTAPTSNLSPDQPIPGTITLANGDTLFDVDVVILCTGYLCAYPFLQQYHNDAVEDSDADDKVLITKSGKQTHNLHKDIFYIPDPSLSFIGVPYHVATFTLYEFQAIAVAAVYSGKVHLPSEEEIREEYRKRLEEKGTGRAFNGLRGKDTEYVGELLEWVNGELERSGEVGRMVEGHTEEWLQGNKWFIENVVKKFGVRFGPDEEKDKDKETKVKESEEQEEKEKGGPREETLTEVVPGSKLSSIQ